MTSKNQRRNLKRAIDESVKRYESDLVYKRNQERELSAAAAAEYAAEKKKKRRKLKR